MTQNPEQITRDCIDTMLEMAGWVVQSKNKINLSTGIGVAVLEYQTTVRLADYALSFKGKAVEIIGAKKVADYRLTIVEGQSTEYDQAKLKWADNPMRHCGTKSNGS